MTHHPNRSLPFDWRAHLRAFRADNGLTQAELANALMTSRRNVEDWERGLSSPPKFLLLALERLAKS